MQKKKTFRKIVVLATLLIGSGSLIACENNTSVVIQDKTVFEKRLWDKESAEDGWTYHEEIGLYDNGMLRFAKNDAYVITEKIEVDTAFSVDVTISLNGGSTINGQTEGKLKFGIEALDANKNVVSSHYYTDLKDFPKEKETGIVTFHLNSKNKKVRYLKLKLAERFEQNFFRIGVGVARIKVYTGVGEDKPLADDVDDSYVSSVTFTNNQATRAPDYRASEYIAMQDVRKQMVDLKTNGNQKVLVIPVDFSDKTCSSLKDGCDGTRKLIEQAYFGEGKTETTDSQSGWESLSSFYYKSSYGNLNITGRVSSWFSLPYTVLEFYNLTQASDSSLTALNLAVDWYKKTHDDYMEYDQDNDGYFDCVQLIYSQENCGTNKSGVCSKKNAQDLFWAFTWKNSSVVAQKGWPTGYNFVWMSYDFLYNDYNVEYKDKAGNVKADAHTVIHESGHALGLDDYYNYDRSSEKGYGPAGKIDMMDNNVGDHNAFSKWQLNWISPKVQVTTQESYEVTLKPFESSGDFAILPAYNQDIKTSCAEYLAFEYYTPTGLNEQDSKAPYDASYGAQSMTEKGLKIYHVDARLAYLNFNNTTGQFVFSNYLDVNEKTLPSTTDTVRVEYAHENSDYRSHYDDYEFRKLLALQAGGVNTMKMGAMLSNADLWKVNGDFGKTVYQNFVFNNGYENPYTMDVVSMDDNGITLRFTRTA